MGLRIIRPEDRNPQPLAKYPDGVDEETARQSTRQILSEAGPYVQLTKIEAGGTIPGHSHAAPEAMVILNGGVISDGETLGPGTIVIIPANQEYGFEVAEGEDLQFVVVRPESGGFSRAKS